MVVARGRPWLFSLSLIGVASLSGCADEPGSFHRAELAVIDADYATAIASVTFEPCSGAGATCGYEGSGCCNGCDKPANTCL